MSIFLKQYNERSILDENVYYLVKGVLYYKVYQFGISVYTLEN